MQSRSSRLACVGSILVLAAATLPDALPPGGIVFSNFPPALRFVIHALTFPIRLQPPSEIRRIVFLIAVGVVLLISGLGGRRAGPMGNGGAAIPTVVRCVAAALVGWAALSCIINGHYQESAGWVVGLAAGVGWMLWLGTNMQPDGVRGLCIGAFGVWIVAGLLAGWNQRIMGLAEPQWPVGSVTATACVAAVVLSWSLSWISGALVRQRRMSGDVTIAAVAAVVGAIVGLSAARRGAWLAVGAALAIVGALSVHRSRTAKWKKRLVEIVGVISMIGLLVFVGYERFGGTWEHQKSVNIRLNFWSDAAQAAMERPVFGFGPERYVAVTTTRFAAMHSTLPALYNAELVNAAHNEWLQSLMELGIPGGLLYLGLPLVVLVVAWRRFSARDVEARIHIAALSAALLALAGTEATSVLLRSAVGPQWYWTILGALAATGRVHAVRERDSGATVGVPIWKAACIAAGLLFLVAAAIDGRSCAAHASAIAGIPEGPRVMFERLASATPRMEAIQYLEVLRDRALCRQTELQDARAAASGATQPAGTPVAVKQAATVAANAWRDLYEVCPGAPQSAARLADALLTAGQRGEALSILRDALSHLATYDTLTNALLAREGGEPFPQRIDRICKGLRNGPIEGEVAAVLAPMRPELDASTEWRRRVENAEKCARGPLSEWTDDETPEVLRVEAWRLASSRQWAAARDAAYLSTRACLSAYHMPRAAPPRAEYEAWQFLARMTYLANPRDYAAAYDAIKHADALAILSVHYTARKTPVDDEYAFGEIVPLDCPDNLCSTWALSSLLHLAMGKTRFLDNRIYAALPSDRRNKENVQRVYADLALQLFQDFARFPPQERPANYQSYLPVVQRFHPEYFRPTSSAPTR